MDTNDKNKAKPKKEYEGVVYEPSSTYIPKGDYVDMRPKTQQRTTPTARTTPQVPAKRKKSSGSQFAIFMIITVFVGVVVCIAMFAMFFNTFSNKPSTNPTAENKVAPSVTATPDIAATLPQETVESIGVVQSIDYRAGTIRVMDVTSDKVFNVYIDGVTTMQNKYGQSISFAEFDTGDVVETVFESKTSKLVSIMHSSQTWEFKLVRDVIVDANERVITIGNSHYTYDENLISMAGGQAFDVAKIGKIDVVTVRGVKSKALYVELNKSHGYLKLMNGERIKNGVMEINRDTYELLGNKDLYDLTEGTHNVMIKGTNIELFIQDIEIESGKTVELDLAQVKVREGVLKISANTTDYKVFVNDEEMPTDEPILLEFGEYTVRVEKEDHLPWEGKAVIQDAVVDVTAELKKEVKMGKLIITSTPEGAEVYIDSGYVGVTPCEIQMEYGQHTIMVRKTDYREVSMDIIVEHKERSYGFGLQPLVPDTSLFLPPTTPEPTTAPVYGELVQPGTSTQSEDYELTMPQE